MNAHEERMCELQAEVFESSLSRFPCGSAKFAELFMRSEVAKLLDDAQNEYNYLSEEEVFLRLEECCPSLSSKKGRKIPSPVMRWIGYIYRCYCIRKNRSSSWLYKKIKIEKMLSLYDSFHTFDPDDCVDRLEEIITANRPNKQTDYEIFKAIRLGNI